jgi:hypothetical protein
MFFETLTRFPAPPPVIDALPTNVYGINSKETDVGKKMEADEIARLNDALAQVIARTEEYKKELMAKKKKLEELNSENVSGGE